MDRHGITAAPEPRALDHPAAPVGHGRLRKALLSCGILAAVLYVGMLIFVPLGWPGYSSTSQAVSELSAIGAPTAALWVTLGRVYTVLLAAFGAGIWMSADRGRALRVAGALLVVAAAISLFWPPMHLRGTEVTLTDTLHIVFTAATAMVTMVAMACAAAAFGTRFRLYTTATIVVMLATGFVTGTYAARIQADLPTPWVGVWERVLIGAFLLWFVVLAVALWRRSPASPPEAVHP